MDWIYLDLVGSSNGFFFATTVMKIQSSMNGGGSFLVMWVRFRASPFEICGGQSGTERDFSLSTSVFPCQYHSTIAPHSSSSTCCSHQKDKRIKPGNLPKNKPLSEIRCKKYFQLVFRGLKRKLSITFNF